VILLNLPKNNKTDAVKASVFLGADVHNDSYDIPYEI
jgi:hypothetical protein